MLSRFFRSLGLTAFLTLSMGASAHAGATLYEHVNYGGGTYNLTSSLSGVNGVNFSNGVAISNTSSVQVTGGCSVTLHTAAGQSQTITSNTTAITYNDQTSSITYTCPAACQPANLTPGSTSAASPQAWAVNSATLDWTSCNATSYEVHVLNRPVGTSTWSTPAAYTVTASQLAVNLTADTDYLWNVRAQAADGTWSAWSANERHFSYVVPPVLLTATAASPTQINLTWQDNSAREIGYVIYQSMLDPVTGTVSPAGCVAVAGANQTSYSLTGLQPERTYFYRLRAATGGGTSCATVSRNSAESNSLSATTPAIPTYTISGKLSLGSGGLDGATVWLSGNGVDETFFTDTTGNFQFTGLLNGTYTLQPSRAGYTFTPTYLTPTVSNANVVNQNFTAKQTFTIRGRILDASGAAVAGVGVGAVGPAGAGTAATNASGYYAIPGMPAGTYTVTPSLNGYGFTPATRSATVSTADVNNQDFTGFRLYYVTGRILKTDGTPVAGAVVSAHQSSVLKGQATTGADGYYTIIDLPQGAYRLTVGTMTNLVFAPAYRDIGLNSNVNAQNFTATQKYTISGKVLNPSGSAVGGVTILLFDGVTGKLMPDEITTAPNGTYSINGLGANTSWTLFPYRQGDIFNPVRKLVQVATSDVPNQDFTTQPKFNITGTVTAPGGGGLAGVMISITRPGSSTQIAYAQTQANGTYTVPNVAGSAAYIITPQLLGYSFTPAFRQSAVYATDLTGQDFTAAPGYFIQGTVRSPANQPIADADIQLHRGGNLVARVKTNSYGVYRFSNLPGGTTYVVNIVDDDGQRVDPASYTIGLNADTSGKDFVWHTDSKLSNVMGRVTVQGGGPGIPYVTLTLTSDSGTTQVQTDLRGEFIFRKRPYEEFTLTASKTGYTFYPPSRQDFTGGGEGVTGMDFAATTAQPVITGQVLDAAGAGAGGVRIDLLSGTTPVGGAVTNYLGYYQIPAQAGTFVVKPRLGDYWDSVVPVDRTVTVASANVTGMNFTIDESNAAGELLSCLTASGSHDACIYWKNPVAQAGEPIRDSSDYNTRQTYAVTIRGTDGSGYLRNSTWNVKPGAGLAPAFKTNGAWKFGFSSCYLGVCQMDPNYRASQVMIYYWLNEAKNFIERWTGYFYAADKGIDVVSYDQSRSTAAWRFAANEINAGNFQGGLSAESMIHEAGHANLAYASPDTEFLRLDCDQQGTLCRCENKAGCPSAIAEGQADYTANMVFSGSTTLGEMYENSTLGFNECGLPRDVVRNQSLTAAQAFNACGSTLTGESHAMGSVFAAALWGARTRSTNPREVDTIVMRALMVIDSGDDFASALAKIKTIDQNYFGTRHSALFQDEFSTRGMLTP